MIIASGDMCPTAAGTIPIAIATENSSGGAIAGTFATPISLSDSDGTGATKLSRTSVTSTSQENVTLAYKPKTGQTLMLITITATVGNVTAKLKITPNEPCINTTPTIVTASKGVVTLVTLKGVGTIGAYNLGTAQGYGKQDCGQDVSVTQKSADTFAVSSRITWVRSCLIFAIADNGNYSTGVGVLLR